MESRAECPCGFTVVFEVSEVKAVPKYHRCRMCSNKIEMPRPKVMRLGPNQAGVGGHQAVMINPFADAERRWVTAPNAEGEGGSGKKTCHLLFLLLYSY